MPSRKPASVARPPRSHETLAIHLAGWSLLAWALFVELTRA